MRGDANWTEVNEIEHWAWEAYGYWSSKWLNSLPEDHAAHYANAAELSEMFIAAHPDGWPRHPDEPLTVAPFGEED